MRRLSSRLEDNRASRTTSIITFINAGDPDLPTTLQIMKLCAEKGIDVIELGVPFANSFTDGNTILKSHQRALKNEVKVEHVLALADEFRKEYQTPIILLADFDYSVKSIGIDDINRLCRFHDIDGLLLHGLPPLYRNEYFDSTKKYNLHPILSLYPASSDETVSRTVENAGGYIYLVNQYGQSGFSVDFQSRSIRSYYARIRSITDLPLMAGFGISSREDIIQITSLDLVDGVIIGSAIAGIIESAVADSRRILNRLEHYLDTIKETQYPDTTATKEINDEFTKRYH